MTNENEPKLPAVPVEGPDGSTPVKTINPETLRQLGQNFSMLFDRYARDRRLAELKWMRNLRQYSGSMTQTSSGPCRPRGRGLTHGLPG